MSLADQQWCPTSVQVTVQQARGLRVKGKSGTNDAYAVMQVGKEKFQTSVVEKSVAPVWREEAAFDLPPLLLHQDGGGGKERGTLHVHVLHRALVGLDKQLGQAVVNLLQLSEDKTRNKTEWFKLLDKTGKADKDRGEVLLDIKFMRNNMTASMFDLSAAGKSRSRLGKFKDKVRGKKKESDTASNVVPSFTQVLTDSDEEGDGEVAAGKGDKKKKHKMKSLFSHKSNLQKNMSQSMTVLTSKNFSLSDSQSSGLNVDSSEGKKKFKFLIHKRSNSSDGKDASSGNQKQGAAEQSNMCINGSHVYCDEPPPRASRTSSNFSLTSSGHGSMEDVPESFPSSVDSLRAVRQYSPWTEEEEEEEEEEELENTKEDVGQLRREEEEKIRMEEEMRREEEARVRTKEVELERLADEKRRQEEEERRTEEENVKREEEEKIRKEEEERRRQEEEERVKREQEERERLAEQKRLQEQERRIEEERVRKEEEKRISREEERVLEEWRRKEEEMVRRQEEEEREEKRRIEEQESRRKEEEEKIRMEEERAREERRRQEEEEGVRRQEEERKLAEEKRRLEEEEKRKLSEDERIRMEEEMAEEERRRDEEEMRQKEKLEEQERRQREHEERIKEEEEKARREKEECERLVEEERIEAEEKIRCKEEEKIREEERVRRQEEREQLAEEKRILEEQERRIEKERKQREEEEMIRKEKRRLEEEERARKEKEDYDRLVVEKIKQEQERRKIEEEEKIKREEEERIRREKKVERERKEEARKLEKEKLTREAEELKKDNKTKQKTVGKKPTVAVESPAEVISTNPFDENFSNNPFEEIPDSPAGPDSRTTKVPTVQQRVQSTAQSVGSKPVSSDEKDPINAQRERRPAPQPPGRNPAERPSQREQDGQHLAKINKKSKDKDIKTVSVLPQRSVQMIAPLTRSPTEAMNTQSLTQSCATKETSNVAKHGKRTAPPRPRSEDEGQSSDQKTALSSDDNISHECGSEAKQVSSVYGLNPFEDDEDENAAQDDSTTSGNTGSVQWPPVVLQAADKDTASQTKIKSSKARAPQLPAKIAPMSSTSINQNPEGGHVTGVTVTSVTHTCDPAPEAVGPVRVQEAPLQESQPVPVQSAGEDTGGKKVGPPKTSRRLQPVKPLNPLEQQSVAVVQGVKDSTGILCDVQVNDSGLKGPYSQLTQGELISLVLKQEKQLSERDKKISELELYIDNLLVRVIEEKPSILLSLNALKKAA
ncbi:rab11 family-interacting protein 1-like [Cebidichthys violaceus]|uniref:rab11 family-interacting protein 1-like n=1 Tax=Cebidichthys violaceus TaxID=271503 RepID=UPI0035CC6EC4